MWRKNAPTADECGLWWFKGLVVKRLAEPMVVAVSRRKGVTGRWVYAECVVGDHMNPGMGYGGNIEDFEGEWAPCVPPAVREHEPSDWEMDEQA